MRVVLKVVLGFVAGWMAGALLGFGADFGMLGVLLPALLGAASYGWREADLSNRLQRHRAGIAFLAVLVFARGMFAGLLVAMVVGGFYAKGFDPKCGGGACTFPAWIGLVGMLGGGIVELLRLRSRIARGPAPV